MCGLTGSVSINGSLFLNELNARTMLLGLKSLELIEDGDPCVVYWGYIASRGQLLSAVVETPEEYAFARLLCLTRIVDADGLSKISSEWELLTADEQTSISKCFLMDGINEKAFMFTFFPLYLANARANAGIGL